MIGPSKMLEFTFDQLAKVDKQTPADKVPTKTQENVTIKLREFTTGGRGFYVPFRSCVVAQSPT